MIAVLHHLSTEQRRLAVLTEMVRCLRPGGKLLVTVWAVEQSKKKYAEQDNLIPWHMTAKHQGNSEQTVHYRSLSVA